MIDRGHATITTIKVYAIIFIAFAFCYAILALLYMLLYCFLSNIYMLTRSHLRDRKCAFKTGGNNMFHFIKEAYHQLHIAAVIIHVSLVIGEVYDLIPHA